MNMAVLAPLMLLLAGHNSYPGLNPRITWQSDYAAALEEATRTQRPMVVVIGSGFEGWRQLTGEAAWGYTTQRQLADKFVCLYLDRDSPHARLQAEDFTTQAAPYLVISDRTLKNQLVKRAGPIPGDEFAHLVDDNTGDKPVGHRSYYEPVVPASFGPGFGGGACST